MVDGREREVMVRRGSDDRLVLLPPSFDHLRDPDDEEKQIGN